MRRSPPHLQRGKDRPKRKLQRHDDTPRFVATENPTSGRFVVTISTVNRKPLIGDKQRRTIEEGLTEMASRAPGVTVAFWTSMPTHVHLILALENAAMGLGRVVESFKWTSTRRLKEKGYQSRNFWQGSYYWHTLPDDVAVKAAQQYLKKHPAVERPRLEDLCGSGPRPSRNGA